MRKSRLIVVLSAVALLVSSFGLAYPATAAPDTQGSTSAPDTMRGGRIDPHPSTAELTRELRRLQWRSRGAVDVSEIGRSNQNRPVWSARVGNGPVRIMYVTQQHGNEPLGTPAALKFLESTGVGQSAWQRWLRSRVTVDVIVRANPDGSELNWRYNYDPDADPEYGEPGKGYDINRYHSPDLAPEDNPATEAGLIQRHFAEFDPDIMVDYHMQGRYRDARGEEITASVMWPTHPGVATDKVRLAKQVSVVAQRAMDLAGANVSQYPGGNYEGIARNAYGLRGSGSVLIELSAMGPEHDQEQIASAWTSMIAIAQSGASGSLERVDPAWAEQIPPRGEPIRSQNASALVSQGD
jgi:hypothetical protein